MATAAKTPKPAAKPVRKAAPAKGKTSLDYLQQALDDLDKARAKAQQDTHAAIDAAVERIRAAAADLRSRAAEPARDIEERLEQVSEDARREIGRMAIDAQRRRYVVRRRADRCAPRCPVTLAAVRFAVRASAAQ